MKKKVVFPLRSSLSKRRKPAVYGRMCAALKEDCKYSIMKRQICIVHNQVESFA